MQMNHNTVSTGQAARAGTFAIGGDMPVVRLGFGSMQLPGPGVWGPPKDRSSALKVLRRSVELGVTLIDTADAYGPDVAEELIHDALHPYPDDLVIATKVGFERPGPGRWSTNGRPEHLRTRTEDSLRKLGVERIDLLQLHRIDPAVPLEDQIGTLEQLRREGKVRHIGLSEVTIEQLQLAREVAPIASVQNLYNLGDRSAGPLLNYAAEHSIGFIPWFPLATGQLASAGGLLRQLSTGLKIAPSALALAWLLHKSPVLLPIPGTSSTLHLEQNVAAAEIQLSGDVMEQLDAIV